MSATDLLYAAMFWSAIAFPLIAVAFSMVVGLLLVPFELGRLARPILVIMAATLVVIAIPGLVLLIGS